MAPRKIKDYYPFCFLKLLKLPESLRDITWLHTRACKYNLSALETYSESEGVRCTYLSFT